MKTNKINRIVIAGGGTAGWITASLLSKVLGQSIKIILIESDKIGTIGVGEATIPPIIAFNNALGINEKDFIKATNATIKLGIQFENWGKLGDSYMHAFGDIGKNFPFCEFHHFWVKSQQMGIPSNFWDYSLNYQAASHNKFAKLNNLEGTNLPGISYAYHFDASLYAKFLSDLCKKQGVERVEGIIKQVNLNSDSGFVDSLQLENGLKIEGDLFVDCTGLAGLLIEKTLSTGFDDWSHWLPCNRAVAVQSDRLDPVIPYTRSIAHDAGWQWQIPLKHRTGNGLVFSSKYLSDDQAIDLVLKNIDGKLLTQPRVIGYRTGRRLKQWHRNVVCIGLSAGFFEPLESTNIHLIQTAVIRLLKNFSHNGIQHQEIDEYNNQTKNEYERIRDFIILHYKLNQRNDSDFWKECRRMEVPQSLSHRIALFKKTGKVFREQDDLFTEIAWKQVMLGQGGIPLDYHPLADTLTDSQIKDLMTSLKTLVDRSVSKMSTHEDFLLKE
ncbi:MAG: tryptophan 7-halogenase [Enterobacterales bacterium]|nr:tryptophan 7-halogenase [Enterobacterales bacterium]